MGRPYCTMLILTFVLLLLYSGVAAMGWRFFSETSVSVASSYDCVLERWGEIGL